jgi:hypothetical protein
MEEFGFYSTLLSNASKKMYPKNNASHFRVQLPTHKNLDPQWVVGLSQIDFPLSFTLPSISSVEGKVSTKHKRMIGPEPVRNPDSDSSNITVPFPIDSYVDDPSEVCDYGDRAEYLVKKHKIDYDNWQSDLLIVRNTLERCEVEKRQEFTKSTERMKKLMDEQQSIIQSKDNQMNSYKSSVDYWKNNFVSLAHMAYRDANQMNNPDIPKYLYIYCDIVEMGHLGDTYANYLHIARVPPIRINGDTCRERFDIPKYRQLCKSSFDRIEIKIRDEKGRLVQFEHGNVIIELHFKRISC